MVRRSGDWELPAYQPPTGFVSRTDVMLSSPAIIGDLRTAWKPALVRNFRPAVVAYVFHGPREPRLQEGFVETYVDVIAQNGAVFYPYVQQHFQRPVVPTPLLAGVTHAPGEQDYVRTGARFSSDQSRKVSITTCASTGTFFDGRLEDLELPRSGVFPSTRVYNSSGSISTTRARSAVR